MIRSATLEDVSQIVRLIQPYIDDFAIHESGREKFKSTMITKFIEMTNVHYFVYESQKHILGIIAYKEPAHLVHFFVEQTHQQKGIGQVLWKYVQAHIQDTDVQVFTVNSSCYAQKIYEKFGFVAVSDVIENQGLKFIKMQRKMV